MGVTDVQIANREMAAAWDGHEGDVWTEHADRYDRANRYMAARFLAAGLLGRGDDVLDLGCGTGAVTRDVARTTSGGTVLGIDLSSRMLQLARERSAADGLDNIEFVQGDAQVYPFEPASRDIVISNFGCMFFGDPDVAWRNIARSLRPGGRLALVAWRTVTENEWLMELRRVLAFGRDLPLPPPNAPTPFAFADPEYARQVFERAGFQDVTLHPIDELLDLGDDVEDACAFASTMGIVEGLLDGLDEETRAKGLDALRSMLASHATTDGVRINCAAWLITAVRAP
jgi:SAM-dependent methyltransferase